jgi:hypothetical protein
MEQADYVPRMKEILAQHPTLVSSVTILITRGVSLKIMRHKLCVRRAGTFRRQFLKVPVPSDAKSLTLNLA